MSKHRNLSSLVFALVTFAGAGVLVSSPAQADGVDATFTCGDKACWGANTCEYHGGTNCDISTPDICTTCTCGTPGCVNDQ